MSAGLSPTGISWTHLPGLGPGHVLNPILGCQHAGGPGCDHCWAETDTAMRVLASPAMAKANAGLTVLRPNGRERWTGAVNFLPERLAGPLRNSIANASGVSMASVNIASITDTATGVTTTVRASGGAADCTLIFTGGILTGGTC